MSVRPSVRHSVCGLASVAEPAVEFPLNLIQGVSYVSVFKKGEFRENQRCDSHTIFRGLNKLHLPLYEYIKDV